jgi:hypothetical protein
MKNFLILFTALIFCSCTNNEKGYGSIQNEDDLSKLTIQIAQEYTKAEFENASKVYSDSVSLLFNSNEVIGKENLINGWIEEHRVFSNISISDEYVHTNTFADGRVWTNYWFVWKGTGNFTGKELEIRAHFDYKWENGKIVRAQGYFSDEDFNKEYAAADGLQKRY